MKKTIILANFTLIFALIFIYGFYPKNTSKMVDNEVTIFTLEPLLGIHAKMITANDEDVHISPGNTLSKEARTQLHQSDIILSSKLLSQSEIGKELQSYKWLYITIPSGDTKGQKTHSLDMLISQVELIRDTLSDAQPSQRGYYYDNAGNYIHLLRSTLVWFRTRIDEYAPSPFITVGDDLHNFLKTLDIEEYRAGHYATPWELVSNKKLWDLIVEKDIRSVFSTLPLQASDKQMLEKKYNLVVYQLPSLENDTSRWGYIRFAGKMMNDFVAAFDTYD